MIVGSTDRISTRGPAAFATNDGSATAIAAIKGTFKRRIWCVSTLSLPGKPPFLTGAQGEGERYFRGPRTAIPNLRGSVFESRAAGSKATVPSPANAAIAADYRANFARPRQHFWRSSLLRALWLLPDFVD